MNKHTNSLLMNRLARRPQLVLERPLLRANAAGVYRRQLQFLAKVYGVTTELIEEQFDQPKRNY